MADNNWTYTERESKTYEVIAERTQESGYVKHKIVYRFWPIGDGDWKIQVIDSDHEPVEPIIIPEPVLDKILNVRVKGELKK